MIGLILTGALLVMWGVGCWSAYRAGRTHGHAAGHAEGYDDGHADGWKVAVETMTEHKSDGRPGRGPNGRFVKRGA